MCFLLCFSRFLCRVLVLEGLFFSCCVEVNVEVRMARKVTSPHLLLPTLFGLSCLFVVFVLFAFSQVWPFPAEKERALWENTKKMLLFLASFLVANVDFQLCWNSLFCCPHCCWLWSSVFALQLLFLWLFYSVCLVSTKQTFCVCCRYCGSVVVGFVVVVFVVVVLFVAVMVVLFVAVVVVAVVVVVVIVVVVVVVMVVVAAAAAVVVVVVVLFVGFCQNTKGFQLFVDNEEL